MRTVLPLAFAVVVAAVAACYTGPTIDPVPSGPEPAQESDPTIAKDMPCEVAELLETHCVSCHAAPPTQGAQSTLTSRAGMRADWDGRTLGAVALARMRDTAAPMPPTGLLSEKQFAAFAKWVEGGMPEGACGAVATPPASGPAPELEIKCTSGRFWDDDDDEGDARMTPGRACISCHSQHAKKERDDDDDEGGEDDEAPLFTFAGTVYPTALEPDDCFGLASGTKVVLTGADGQTLTLTANTSGNFMTKIALALPYKASVVRNGKTLSMKAEQTDGDCNGCHSVPGTPTADMPVPPGRIVAP